MVTKSRNQLYIQNSNDMKTFIRLGLTLCFFFLIDRSDGQNILSNDSVTIRGYVVTELNKQEVIDKKTDKDKGIFRIDSHFRVYFLPFNDGGLDVAVDSLYRVHPNFEVFLPSNELPEMIDIFCNKHLSLFKNFYAGFSLKNQRSDDYFEIKLSSYEKYIFKFYYIECKALRVSIPNNFDNAIDLNIKYNKFIKVLNCYFVYSTIVIQPIEAINSNKIKNYDLDKDVK